MSPKRAGGGRNIHRENNEEAMDLWLGAYAGNRVPDLSANREGHSPNRKTSAQIESNLSMLDQLEDPHIAESDTLLRHIIMVRAPVEKPGYYAVLHYVYLQFAADIAAPERWKMKSESESVQSKNKALRKLLRQARKWVLDEVGDFVLNIPDPYKAKTELEKAKYRQKRAKTIYLQELKRTGDDAKARHTARKHTGYSAAQLRRLIPPIRKRRRKTE